MMDYITGLIWILIAIMQSFILGWKAWIIWSATVVIWIYIIRIEILKIKEGD